MGKHMNIKKGDTVKVIAGKDKGAQGKVISVLREEDRVIVEGVNLVKRHTKSVQQTGTTGGIICSVSNRPLAIWLGFLPSSTLSSFSFWTIWRFSSAIRAAAFSFSASN